jgi:RNA polymerase sigma-70 factor (ECF subfamily)
MESNLIGYQNHKMLNDEVETIDSSDEEEIIQATREDKTMFVHLYRRYVKDVYRYAFSRLNNPQEAEDITSQTFLTALQSFDQFRGDGCFGAYLIGITRRLIARSFRHKENGWVDEISQLEISKSQSEEQITQKLNLDQVIGELASIPEKRAEAIRLYYFAGLQMKEVAKVMRKSEMAIRMLVHRGIIDLQKRLLDGNKR